MSVPRFWRRLRNLYNLIGTKCEKCGEYHYPPRNICPTCRRGGSTIPYKFKGDGEVMTYTIVHSSSKNHSQRVPYILAIIKLEEGPHLTAQVVCDPQAIEIGMKVKPIFRRLGEENAKGMIYYGTKFAPQ